MTSSDAIMLAQLCAALLIASSVALISSIKDGVPVEPTDKKVWLATVTLLTVAVVLCLVVAGFSTFLPLWPIAWYLLYFCVGVGAIITAVLIWGQVQAAIRRANK